MEDWQWQLGIIGGTTTAWALGLALFALWLFELRSIRGESHPLRRFTLAAFGGVGMLAVYALALQITLVRETFEEVAGGTALLIDSSRSMTLSGSAGPRGDAVRALIRKWQKDEQVEPVVYLFGSHTRAAMWSELDESYEPIDDQTNIRDGLTYVLQRRAEQELGSMIVVTDGADPKLRAETLSLGAAAPVIHAVVVGGDDPLDDQAIVSLRADATAYVGVPAVIRAEIRAAGALRDQNPRVQLWHESRLEQESLVQLDPSGSGSVVFEVTPQHPGRALYRLLIPQEANDEVPQNNQRAALLRVGRDRVRVLLVAGRPSWDVRFLRDFVKRDGSVDLISFFILRAPSDLTAAPANELALIPFPTDELFREHLGSFDVIIFQNFDYAPYEMQSYLPRIRDYVNRGGSFAMIGGDRSFSLGGYAGTAIEDVLPVRLSAGGVGAAKGGFRAQAVSQLARHPIIALGPSPSLTLRTWKALPPLQGANMVSSVKENAQVLLHHPRVRLPNGSRLPVLVVGESGRGRVAALMADASWRWRFASGDTTVGSDEYELFWDRLIRWLTRDPLLEPARISTDRERYGVAADVIVSGLLRDERYRPIGDQRVKLDLDPTQDAEPRAVWAKTDKNGQLRTTLRAPSTPGAFEVTASIEDEEIAAEVFIVEESGDELANLEVMPNELEAIANETGGDVFLKIEDVPPLAELASTTRKAAGLVSKQPLSNPVFVLLTVLFLGVTWVLRRRWGRR